MITEKNSYLLSYHHHWNLHQDLRSIEETIVSFTEKKVNFLGLSTINYNLRESSLMKMSYFSLTTHTPKQQTQHKTVWIAWNMREFLPPRTNNKMNECNESLKKLSLKSIQWAHNSHSPQAVNWLEERIFCFTLSTVEN